MFYQGAQDVNYFDVGLQKYMRSVFNNMGLGLLLSGIISYIVGTDPQLFMLFFGGPQVWLVMLAPLALVFFIGFKIQDMTPSTAKMWFFIYAGLTGLSLASIFAIFKLGSILQVFFISATMFGTTALYGYTTKKDLTNMGTFLMMGLIGVIIAGLVNIFLQSSMLQFVISLLSVVIFVGLTAWDVQQIKSIYYDTYGDDRERAGIMGALTLYLDFINIFVNLLQLVSERKD
jgi:FtsH-binding integral membrane protein